MLVDVNVPAEHANDAVVEVVRWLVAHGQWVAAGADLVEIESAKATVTIAAGADGYIEQRAAEGEVVAVGGTVARIHPTPDGMRDAPAGKEKPSPSGSGKGPRFSEDALRDLARLGIAREVFSGERLVTSAMVRNVRNSLGSSEAAGERRIIAPAKRAEINRLTAGRAALAAVLTVQFDSSGIREAQLRAKPPQPLLLPAILYTAATLIRDFPELNARFVGPDIELYPAVNVGIAVDLGRGLRVPVIRGADQLTLLQVADALLALLARYQRRQLSPDDLRGGTITVSDLSAEGVIQFQPLMNQDQSLALGIGGDPLGSGYPMTVTAVFDHRVASGRQVAAFLRQLKSALIGMAGSDR
jgi:2-oxoglutarate dehydrogenase E2 component (dihydrolipoamide succinyltransferase)